MNKGKLKVVGESKRTLGGISIATEIMAEGDSASLLLMAADILLDIAKTSMVEPSLVGARALAQNALLSVVERELDNEGKSPEVMN